MRLGKVTVDMRRFQYIVMASHPLILYLCTLQVSFAYHEPSNASYKNIMTKVLMQARGICENMRPMKKYAHIRHIIILDRQVICLVTLEDRIWLPKDCNWGCMTPIAFHSSSLVNCYCSQHSTYTNTFTCTCNHKHKCTHTRIQTTDNLHNT